jgi:translation initiation factor IF-3
MDFGKYKYELEQKAKRAKKHQTSIVLKEIKMRPKIEDHDFEVKKRHVERFLQSGAKVKVTIMFRGREMTHTDIGRGLLDRLVEETKDLGTVELQPKLDGRNMIMVLAPVATSK